MTSLNCISSVWDTTDVFVPLNSVCLPLFKPYEMEEFTQSTDELNLQRILFRYLFFY